MAMGTRVLPDVSPARQNNPSAAESRRNRAGIGLLSKPLGNQGIGRRKGLAVLIAAAFLLSSTINVRTQGSDDVVKSGVQNDMSAPMLTFRPGASSATSIAMALERSQNNGLSSTVLGHLAHDAKNLRALGIIDQVRSVT